MQKNNPFGWNLAHTYQTLPEIFYTEQSPRPAMEAKIVMLNEKLAEELGLAADKLQTPVGAAFLSGSQLPPGAKPIAQSYAGHQFGVFTMLGDGRAILLGEQKAEANQRFDIQLKGAGRTKYSRGGDGRGALGPMLREYLISEAMHGLNIPTTRSLAVTTTGEPVMREKPLKGAVLTRVSASHLRVGTFQFAAAYGRKEDVIELADYAISRHDPELASLPDRYAQFYEAVIKRQAELIAKWQLVGFVHGVMNTDNMTISGETIDYGPCAFIDVYKQNTVFSSIDREGRYAFVNQPYMAQWNLARLGEALLPLFADDEEEAIAMAKEKLAIFHRHFTEYYLDGMRMKLGLATEEEEDVALVQELLRLMEVKKLDYTNTFLALIEQDLAKLPGFDAWFGKYQSRLAREDKSADEVMLMMKVNNPAIIPRNYFVEEALTASVEENDFSKIKALTIALANPYAHDDSQKKYQEAPDSDDFYQTYCGT